MPVIGRPIGNQDDGLRITLQSLLCNPSVFAPSQECCCRLGEADTEQNCPVHRVLSKAQISCSDRLCVDSLSEAKEAPSEHRNEKPQHIVDGPCDVL